MDLEQIVSYGELRDALPGTGKGRVPRLNQLKKMARVVLHRKTASGVIEIYSNGFFSFEECGRVTVYGVDRCERPETYTCNGKKEAGMEKLDLGEYPWEVILESAGSARLEHNADSRRMCREVILYDSFEFENNIDYSMPPEHESREAEEEMAAWKAERNRRMREVLSTLTEKQYQIVIMHRVQKMTQEQIATKLGISRSTLRNQLRAIEKKLNKFA